MWEGGCGWLGVWVCVQGRVFCDMTLHRFLSCTLFCTSRVECFPEILVPLLSYKSQVSDASSFCRMGVLRRCMNKAEGRSALSTCSVFSESTKYMFVFTGKYKVEKPTYFDFKNTLFIWLFLERKLGWTFFFPPVGLSDLPCVSWKQNWELKESTLEGKKSEDAFHHLANQKPRYGLLFFLSSPTTPGNIGSPDSIGKGKNDLILIGHLSWVPDTAHENSVSQERSI